MPPKKSDNADGPAVSGLRDNELRFIKAVFDNMTQKPDANWTQVASDLGLKDAKCAKERFRQMSVRHGWRTTGQTTPGSSPSKAKKGDVTGPSGDGKVAKKPRVRTPRKPVAKKDLSEDDEGDDVHKDEDDVKEEKMGSEEDDEIYF
ncbi:uncharacterized protein TRIREDRAFT_102774 [Trichoderma reesei QM6a]|jgi:hypothetical protein|uniref:Predicted protein n=2 Tax=Hypocrea jecorina TaxID=51453 RepID=G0R885_HYPJQ|nr:uncharacterized protein TRIREDRAFT_102774 [Trichoderma reesei QM6a]EGR52834.1 predicted protein [Trichoderma reesei QM6a]ETS06581.1 hypothetical protein M419DRAFT_69804 [Trichoderma reesei RUT C-30]